MGSAAARLNALQIFSRAPVSRMHSCIPARTGADPWGLARPPTWVVRPKPSPSQMRCAPLHTNGTHREYGVHASAPLPRAGTGAPAVSWVGGLTVSPCGPLHRPARWTPSCLQATAPNPPSAVVKLTNENAAASSGTASTAAAQAASKCSIPVDGLTLVTQGVHEGRCRVS